MGSAVTFTTLTYFCFLPLVFSLHWLLRDRQHRNFLLMVASYIFYGWWDWRFCGLMLLASLIDFVAGWAIDATENITKRRIWLIVSMGTNLTMLGFFKYFNFFADSLQQAGERVGWHFDSITLSIVLPVGISFYTFQTMSYAIDIYRRQLKATHNIVEFLTFVSFFPQLVAGPIERATDLLPQFMRPHTFNPSDAALGLRYILWGAFKKLVIADRLALFVDAAYNNPSTHSGVHLALATIAFAFQIYCDFSAYSDMAVGSAKLFDIQLSRNFAYPYFSQSITEFWRRWHISLSTWFRDYLYIPLGGSKMSRWRSHLNLFITFLVSGFWHGAAWRFLIWGGIHGAASTGTKLVGWADKVRIDDVPGGNHLIARPMTILKILTTFLIVCAGWVFFRANSLPDAFQILQTIGEGMFYVTDYYAIARLIRIDKYLRTTFILLIAFVAIEWLQRRRQCPLELSNTSRPVRWAVYTVLLWGTLLLLPSAVSRPFIYFDF